jgi:preprotein translocase subunit YajC
VDILLVLVAVLAAFYFILLKPVINQQRKQRRDISSLEIGDEVLTTGGFYATVKEINTHEDRPMEILLEAAPGIVLRGTTVAVQEISRRAADLQSDPEASHSNGPSRP